MSVTIGNSVTRINPEAFFNCNNLTSFTVDAANPAYSSVDGVLFNKDQTELIQYPGKKAGAYSLPDTLISIRGFAFWNCTDLTNVEIPDSVTTIGESAFGGCDDLISITLGSSVTTISGYAFMNCADLASITIPDGITSIREGTFINCDTLTSITIPDSVTTIWERAYSECDALTSVSIPGSVTSIGDEAFSGCDKLTSITVDPANPAYSSLDGVLFNKDHTELIQYPGAKAGAYTVPDSVTKIGDGAFYSCQTLNNVIVGNGVTSIDSYVFDNCSKLTGIYFKGNAPALDSSVNGVEYATVYYLPWASGWETTYGGLPTAEWPLAPADVNIDGYVNLIDFSLFAGEWLQADCQGANNWCGRTDFDQNGDVGPLDLNVLTAYWLDVSVWTPSPADVDINGEVDLTDFSVFGSQWGQTGCDASNDWCGWADFNQSGTVDVADLTLLGDDWLYGTTP
jgi:hypothetical protein